MKKGDVPRSGRTYWVHWCKLMERPRYLSPDSLRCSCGEFKPEAQARIDSLCVETLRRTQ